ncbi:hypothetical protein VSO92_12540 [Myroides pelagicus]|uniref:hypothetical protein n=1 Tax=Myroides pelagicus TaxID=270914 RepID=UPI002DBDBCD4|nr:hypothetical protein [Myroides pelagicus]MEC4114930.1 hypothetical protein [Myroides pelagicus]
MVYLIVTGSVLIGLVLLFLKVCFSKSKIEHPVQNEGVIGESKTDFSLDNLINERESELDNLIKQNTDLSAKTLADKLDL